jgi:hypothetical protein
MRGCWMNLTSDKPEWYITYNALLSMQSLMVPSSRYDVSAASPTCAQTIARVKHFSRATQPQRLGVT